jgi:hypothetical protein
MYLATPVEVETLRIVGCDCLNVFLEASLLPIFQGLQYDYERSVLRALPSFFWQVASKGKPARFSREEFLRLVDDKKNLLIEQQKREPL